MKKRFKSILGLAIALLLVLPNVALAQGEPQAYPIKKTVTAHGDYNYFNGNQYSYTLTPVQAEDYTDVNGKTIQGQPALPAADSFLSLSNGGILSIAGQEIADNGFVSEEIQLLVDNDKLQAVIPGVYEFTLKETATAIDGEVNTALEKTIRVFVTKDEKGNKAATLMVKENETIDLGKTNLNSNSTFTTHTLTVTKVITGNNANMNEKFNFAISIAGQAEDQHKIDDVLAAAGENEKKDIGNAGSFVVKGLTPKDVVKISEKDAKGYDVSYNPADYDPNKGILVGEENKELTVTNTLDRQIPTGIIETVAPFALALVLVPAFAFVYFKKSRKEA